jgi:hypothetical protein
MLGQRMARLRLSRRKKRSNAAPNYFYLHHEGQDIKLIQHRKSEYKHITQNLEE